MKQLLELLQLSTEFLKNKGIADSRREAQELFCDALGLTKTELYLVFDRPLTNEEVEKLRQKVMRRSKGEPSAYIHGEVSFYGCRIGVDRSVLIPRQETEILVDQIAATLQKSALSDTILWDICCGSGCIGIALKKKFPDLKVILSDISPNALNVARTNALRNQVDIEFREGNLLTPFRGETADWVVCNPPYISEKEYTLLQKEVKEFEPVVALVSGPTGFEFYEQLAAELPSYLHSRSRVWLEIGAGQGEKVKGLFDEARWGERVVSKDWSGHDRFVQLLFA